jgi:uncharacterized protein (TIGR00369 family)
MHTPAESPGPGATAADAGADIPKDFKPRSFGGGFIAVNGPLYVKQLERGIALGFRVEPRHCNPMGICHGGMMATFCDMLLPISAHYLSQDLARRFLPTINLQVDFLAASALGAWVQGEAQLLRATRSMVYMQGLVTADGENAARVSGIFKIGAPFDDSVNPGALKLASRTRKPAGS